MSATLQQHQPSAATTKPLGQHQSPIYKGGPFVFDCETMPLDESTIRERAAPFVPPDHPGEFDPKSVKCGNLKDPAKIQAKIDEAEFAHSQAVQFYESDCIKLEETYWNKTIERAPLSPNLGRVLAIGIGFADGGEHYLVLNDATDANEAGMLDQWWCEFYLPASKMGYEMIGHNIHDFDVPFLIRRSWMLGVDVPPNVWQGRYLNGCFIDTIHQWKCGSKMNEMTKDAGLDDLGRFLGLGGKTEGMNGGDFHRLYFGTVEERDQAMNYLANDVDLTRKVARRLGLV